MTDLLGRSPFFKGVRRELVRRFGKENAAQLWRSANARLTALRSQHPHMDQDSRMMILPAAALYAELREYAPDQALPLLIGHGQAVGEKIARAVHAVTCLPGLPELLWRFMPRLMRSMSSPQKGYTARIVSESRELVGVDILACPLHNAAVSLGMPEVARIICAMDKAYMTGFRHIRYTRTTSVAEGAECCDYRLRYDRDKA